MAQLSDTSDLDTDLAELISQVARLGGLAEDQVSAAAQVIGRRDVPLARDIIGRDTGLDDLQRGIEQRAITLIDQHRPEGGELRRAISALKLAINLERCGDLARNIAKRGLILAQEPPAPRLTGAIERMGRLAQVRLADSLNAYVAHDLGRAIDVWSRDREVDDHYNSVFREIVSVMTADPAMVARGAHLLFVAKNFERIGDHATNVAEIIHFEITGRELLAERPQWDEFGGA